MLADGVGEELRLRLGLVGGVHVEAARAARRWPSARSTGGSIRRSAPATAAPGSGPRAGAVRLASWRCTCAAPSRPASIRLEPAEKRPLLAGLRRQPAPHEVDEAVVRSRGGSTLRSVADSALTDPGRSGTTPEWLSTLMNSGSVGTMASSDSGLRPVSAELRCGTNDVAAERLAGEQEVHVLQMAVEARRHAHAVEHAEAVAERRQRLDERGGERRARRSCRSRDRAPCRGSSGSCRPWSSTAGGHRTCRRSRRRRSARPAGRNADPASAD